MPRYKSQTLAPEADPAPFEAPVSTGRTGIVEPYPVLVSPQLVCFADVMLYYYNRKPVAKLKPGEVREYFIGMISIGTCWISEGVWRFVWDDLENPMRIKDFASEAEMLAFIQQALKGNPK